MQEVKQSARIYAKEDTETLTQKLKKNKIK